MKTKALISFAVTAKLICDFVFAYAKSRFSHNEAHLIWGFLFFVFEARGGGGGGSLLSEYGMCGHLI